MHVRTHLYGDGKIFAQFYHVLSSLQKGFSFRFVAKKISATLDVAGFLKSLLGY
jgi:hypothetical protein